MTAVAAEARPVRVIVEGIARPVKHDSRYLFVQHGTHSFLVNSEAEGVTVEDIVVARTWTDGDVVRLAVAIHVRKDGMWSNQITTARYADDELQRGLINYAGNCEVLRYQAGEQQ